MSEINKRIRDSRPPLKKVSPLVYRIAQGFVGVNLLLCLYLYNVAERTTDSLPLLGYSISFEIWSVIFFGLATAMALGLARNNWKLTRVTLTAGLFVKTFWTLCLVVLAIQGSNVLHVAILWLFLAWTQAWCVVHFLPVIGWNGVDEQTGRQPEEKW